MRILIGLVLYLAVLAGVIVIVPAHVPLAAAQENQRECLVRLASAKLSLTKPTEVPIFSNRDHIWLYFAPASGELKDQITATFRDKEKVLAETPIKAVDVATSWANRKSGPFPDAASMMIKLPPDLPGCTLLLKVGETAVGPYGVFFNDSGLRKQEAEEDEKARALLRPIGFPIEALKPGEAVRVKERLFKFSRSTICIIDSVELEDDRLNVYIVSDERATSALKENGEALLLLREFLGLAKDARPLAVYEALVKSYLTKEGEVNEREFDIKLMKFLQAKKEQKK